MSFHGNIGYCLGTQNFYNWIRGRPRKGFYHRNSPATYNNQGIRSFLGHAGFYRRFITAFSKIYRPYADYLKKMQSLILMKYAKLHLIKLNPN